MRTEVVKNGNDAQPDRQIELPVEDGLTNIKSVSQRADELLLAEKFTEAEQLYRELCLGLEVLLGAAHPDVAEVRHKLAAALSGQGKVDEAAAQEQSAQIIKSALNH